MAYITVAALSSRLGAGLYARLTDRVSGTTADPVVAQQIVDECEAVADSYLARRYATPVDLVAHPEVAAVLAARVLDLAEYAAWRGSPFVTDLPQRVQKLAQQAGAWFEAVACGEVLLPAAVVPPSGHADARGPLYTAPERPMRAEELDGL